MAAICLEAGNARLRVDPADGGRWTSLEVDGLELLAAVHIAGAHPPVLAGCFAMAPFAGRLHQAKLEWRGEAYELPVHAPPHAIHGTAVDAGWDVVGATGSSVVLEHDLYDPWPFEGLVRAEVALRPGGLDARLSLHAREDMPVVLGWHPWFRRELGRGDPVVVHVASDEQYERGPDGLPTGRLVSPLPGPWDDCFVGLRESPRLVWPEALEVTLTSSADYLVVFDEHPDAVCQEPQTGPPDAVRLGRATVVGAGETLDLVTAMSWTSLASSR